MITLDQLINSIALGVLFIVLGLAPGVLQQIYDGVNEVSRAFSSRWYIARKERVTFKQPRWMAAVGVLVILLSMLAYLTR